MITFFTNKKKMPEVMQTYFSQYSRTTPLWPPHRSCHDYTRLSHEHTMCSSTPSTCAIYQEGVISSDRQLILDSHNKYRAKVARGEESQGLPGPQYSASDMQQLVWNEELAQVAQAWASTCPSYHDCHDCRKLLSSKTTPCSYLTHTITVIPLLHARI